MNREQAIKLINQSRPLLGHELNKALDVVIADAELALHCERQPVYYCSPALNKKCKKGGCYKTGGPCYYTTKAECAKHSGNRPLKAPVYS